MIPSRPRGPWLYLGFVVFAALAILAAVIPPAAIGEELAHFPADAAGTSQWILSIGDCKDKYCALRVTLKKGAGGMNSMLLPKKMYGPLKQTGRPKDLVDESNLYGSRSFVWNTVESDNDAGTTAWFHAAPLRISRSEWGLFVSQIFYVGDWTDFYHTLFAVVDGKATVVWSDTDENAGGPISKPNQTWVTFWRLEGQSGSEAFLFGKVVGKMITLTPQNRGQDQDSEDEDDGDFDLVTVQTMRRFFWDMKARRVVEITTDTPTYAVVLATSEASEPLKTRFGEQFRKDKCLEHFGLHPSDNYPGLKPGFFVIVSLQVGQTNAEQLLKDVKACDPKLADGYLRRITYQAGKE